MNRIAIISDIHGNREALKTTLEDIKKRKCDKIICLGDIIAKGKFSNECVNIIKDNCDVVLRGNVDDKYSKEYDFNKLDEKEKQLIIKHQMELTSENKEYLSNLPFCYEFYLSGRLVRLFHAGPDSMYNYSNVGIFASIDKKYKMFEPNVLTLSDNIADIVVYGHIHTQLMNKMYNRTLICCGSIGNNLEYIRNEEKDANILNTTCANYVILEGKIDSKEQDTLDIDFIQVQYDIDKEIEDSKDKMENDELFYELKHGKYRDDNKINRLLLEQGIDINNI